MKIKLLLLGILLATGFGTANGQSRFGSELSKILDAKSATGWLYFVEGTNVRPEAFFDIYGGDMNLGTADEMRLVKKETDDMGFTHYYFQQYHSGIRVMGAEFFVHTDPGGNLYSANGVLEEGLVLQTSPALSADQAIVYAKQKMGAKQYRWESEFWEQELRQHKGKEHASYLPKPELVVFKGKEGVSLVYSIDLYSADPFDEKRYLVDAATGEIAAIFPLSSNCNPTTLSTVYNGNQSISTDKFATGPDNYRSRDDCQSAEINVRDWNSSTLTSSPVDITSSANTWTTNNQRFAGSVLWTTKQAYTYYLNVFSRNSYDNLNGDVDGFINAQFPDNMGNPTPNNASMSFSGGTLKVGLSSTGTLNNSYAALDILGHEYTHAVTGSEAMLAYAGESGALNESFSDIFGEMIENFVNGTCDYLVGNDRSSGALRDMSAPNNGSQPDTYLGTNWSAIVGPCNGMNDQCGVHTNSGVQNFWFFLLAEGGSGTNDNGDGFNVTGIGKASATRIVYKSLTDILTSSSDYAAARAASIMAANMIFGNCSFQTQQVINAWNAVGVYNTTGFDCGCGTNVIRSGAEVSGTYESSTWIRSTAVVSASSIVVYDADQYVTMQPGFHAVSGSKFRAIIDGCFGTTPKPADVAAQRADHQGAWNETVTGKLEKSAFTVFPNPADNEILVSFTLPGNGSAQVKLINLQGREVANWQTPADDAGTAHTVRFDVSQLPAGFYLCTLDTDNQRMVQKIVVSR